MSFWQRAAQVLNAGQTRALLLTGNVRDLFPLPGEGADADYAPLTQALLARWSRPPYLVVVYELNGPIRFMSDADRDKVRSAWLKWRTGLSANDLAIRKMLASGKVKADLDLASQAFDDTLHLATGRPTTAFELLRQICLCSRTVLDGAPCLAESLLILIEDADFSLPDAPVSQMSPEDRQRISICQDWFSDPGFMDGKDSVVLMAESRSLLHQRIAQLPQLLDLEVPPPNAEDRLAFLSWFDARQPDERKIRAWGSLDDLAKATAGLSLHGLRQMLRGVVHAERPLARADAVAKVEAFIQSQMGEDVVEFSKPAHRLEDVIGFTRLKSFLREELMPRFQAAGSEAISGAAVCGPIGGGKTFIFEAMAAELDMVVLVLKNIRSQWYGQTDVIFERLRRLLTALDKVVIFVDEADTQFGQVGMEAHSTERRLTGKIQAMMSDPQLRGRVLWLLMTARIHQLSPDIRRPGRAGDLIIPVLDPEGEDRTAFLHWMVKPALGRDLNGNELTRIQKATEGFYSASYAAIRSELKARARRGGIDFEGVLALIADHLTPDIASTRRYQTLQALMNCTRRSLLPDPSVRDEEREAWARELRALEAAGIG